MERLLWLLLGEETGEVQGQKHFPTAWLSGRSVPAGFHILSPLSIIAGLWPEYYYSHFTDREPDSDWAGHLPTEPSYPGLSGTKAWGDTRPLRMTPS